MNVHLNCLIEDETIVFVVTAESSLTISQLMKAIQKERALDTVSPPANMQLWKVNIDLKPYEHSFSGLRFLKGNDKGNEMLLQSKSISQYWPEQPSRKHLHVIVKILCTDEDAIKKRNTMPIDAALDIDTIDNEIQEELLNIQWVVEKFLENPELPLWVPSPNYTTPNNCEFLTALQIPAYRNDNRPSLLFHNLNICDGEEIKKIFRYICNTSGSGKTRRLMEALTQYWGFYFIAAPGPADRNGVGIQDLQNALNLAAEDREWVSDLHFISPKMHAVQNEINSQIASRVFQRVLAARIVVFEFFLKLAIQVDGHLQERHKRIWLLFQSFNSLGVRGESSHPLFRIINKLHCASDEALDILVGRLDNIVDTYIPQSQLILGLDDVQWAAGLYPHCGISMISPRTKPEFRSIIHEMVKVFTKVRMKLVLSGTSLLPLADINDAIFSGAAGVAKPDPRVKVFHELGMFDTWPKLNAFFEQYVPPSFLDTSSGDRLQLRMRGYLLGRYRFFVSFLEYFLMNGLQSPHKLLTKYLEAHIPSHFPGDTGGRFASDEPDPHVDVQLKVFDWDMLQFDPIAIEDAMNIVLSHLIRGRTPEYGPVSASLVTYGIARLGEGHKGHIVEALAFLSLMKWLQARPNSNLDRFIMC